MISCSISALHIDPSREIHHFAFPINGLFSAVTLIITTCLGITLIFLFLFNNQKFLLSRIEIFAPESHTGIRYIIYSHLTQVTISPDYLCYLTFVLILSCGPPTRPIFVSLVTNTRSIFVTLIIST